MLNPTTLAALHAPSPRFSRDARRQASAPVRRHTRRHDTGRAFSETIILFIKTLRAMLLATAAATLLSSAALADTRIFIIGGSDGYGVDSCLSSGARCGERIATLWCQAHSYARALDFGPVERSALSPVSTGSGETCTGALCPAAIAITCSR